MNNYKWTDYDEYKFLKKYSNYIQWCYANQLKPMEPLQDKYFKWVDEIGMLFPQYNDTMNTMDSANMKRYGQNILSDYPDHYKVMRIDERNRTMNFYNHLLTNVSDKES